MSMEGHPVTIITLDEDEKLNLDLVALGSVLNQPELKDRPVCLLPIAGAFRKGKSFLLNVLLHHLQAEGKGEDWLEKGTKGFPTLGGSEGVTQGVLLWSAPLTLQLNGQTVAVLLMDTQGAFDRQTSMKATSALFSIALLTSSTLILNLDENIQEDDLQHLQFFTHYGRLVEQEQGGEGCQKLFILVRDWQFPYEKQFGVEGGAELLRSVMEETEEMPEEGVRLRRDLEECFQDISCFLLPYPGRGVTNPAFTGSVAELDSEFVTHVRELVKTLLEGLVPKQEAGKTLRCRDLIHYFKAFVNILNSSAMPEARTLLDATVEAGNLARAAAARELHQEGLEEAAGGSKPYLNPATLEEEHRRLLAAALQLFTAGPRLGGESGAEEHKQLLVQEMEETFAEFLKLNESKNIMAVAGTPLTLAGLWVVLYLVSCLASILLLSSVLSIIAWIQLTLVGSGVAWAGSKYSGRLVAVGSFVDSVTGEVRQLVMPLLGRLVAEKYTVK